MRILPPPGWFPPLVEAPGNPLQVLCAARIEPLKNQLNLIRGLKDSEFELVLAGQPAPHHHAYAYLCRAEAGARVHFAGQLDRAQLIEAYSSSAVSVLPSRFETTGLSTIEAMAAGVPVVCGAGEAVREIFGARAEYCEPENPQSILEAVRRASNKPIELRKADAQWARHAFSAEKIVRELIELYASIQDNI